MGIVIQEDLDEGGTGRNDGYHMGKNSQAKDGKTTKKDGGSVDEASIGGVDQVALRQYELSKLKYYFAVVECSSIAAAETLYKYDPPYTLEYTSFHPVDLLTTTHPFLLIILAHSFSFFLILIPPF